MSRPLLLGIEIGGTKLQVGLGRGDGAIVALERLAVEPARGAAGILAQIPEAAGRLLQGLELSIEDLGGVGIGFGGPVDAARGRVVVSHQVAGWEDYPLVDWARATFGGAAVGVANDADTAALGEARHGAGVGYDPVLYVTVGSGVGGGLVVGGSIYGGSGRGAVEVGHLLLDAAEIPADVGEPVPLVVEDLAAGWSIARMGRRLVARAGQPGGADPVGPLVRLCGGDPNRVTGEVVARAAAEGDGDAAEVLARARSALARGLAHAVTLLAPARVVLGGGVSLIGEDHWLGPIRREVEARAFPPLRGRFDVVPAALGEAVVVHGALALADEARRRAGSTG